MHLDPCAFVNTDPEKFGALLDDLQKVTFTPPRIHMLVDGRIREEPKSSFMAPRYHNFVGLRIAANEERTLNGCARRKAEHDTAASDQFLDSPLHGSIEISVCQPHCRPPQITTPEAFLNVPMK